MREYSTREVAEISSLPEQQIRRWARAGLVTPVKDESGHWRFSFQDLALLRTAGKLLEARVSPSRVTRTLHELREQLPSRPLSAVSLVVAGGRVIVRDRMASWVLESRQGVFGFEMEAAGATPESAAVSPVPPKRRATESADALYRSALDLELAGRLKEAEAAYRAALGKNAKLVDARINLGRLLHAADRLREAESLYREALDKAPDNPLAAFNLGVVLEDQGKTPAAVEAYRRAIGIDDDHADAHFNLSRLLEQNGDRQAALRHLARFKRLTR
ncbi:MAG TPA: tetratricopeptide repeat protein [Gammaproteobacteria bacterium]|nr:tetratricopeptide repeat protein [Gammaproteobacteria bacterium]